MNDLLSSCIRDNSGHSHTWPSWVLFGSPVTRVGLKYVGVGGQESEEGQNAIPFSSGTPGYGDSYTSSPICEGQARAPSLTLLCVYHCPRTKMACKLAAVLQHFNRQ